MILIIKSSRHLDFLFWGGERERKDFYAVKTSKSQQKEKCMIH